MSENNPPTGLSLLDIVFLNQIDDRSAEKLQALIREHGSIERNIALHHKLLKRLPQIFEKSNKADIKSDRPLALILNRITELEERIDQFISLSIEAELNIPDSAYIYVRLRDIIEMIRNENHADTTDSPQKRLDDETKKIKDLSEKTDHSNVFRNEGDIWKVVFNGETKSIKHTKGMDYIAYLIRYNGNKIDCITLYQVFSAAVPDIDATMSKAPKERIESDQGLHKENESSIEITDEKTLEAVEKEISTLEGKLNDAMTQNDTIAECEISNKLEKLKDYVDKCIFKGKIITNKGATEKIRQTIQHAIRRARININKHNPALATHLEKTVTTGMYCVYESSDYDWVLD